MALTTFSRSFNSYICPASIVGHVIKSRFWLEGAWTKTNQTKPQKQKEQNQTNTYNIT